MAEITWFGHACFRIRGREAVVLTDPVGPRGGLRASERAADIITVSQPFLEGTTLEGAGPGTRIVSGPGEYEVADVFITGIRSFRDDTPGARRGPNTIYMIEIEDLVICHLGSLAHVLTEEQAGAMSSVDVLLVPVGGGPVLDAATAVEVIGQVEPSVVIPMQYATERGDEDLEPLDRFLKQVGSPDVVPMPRFNVKKSDLGEAMQVVVLQAPQRA